MSDTKKNQEKKKKQESWLEQQIIAIMEKSMKQALDMAIDDLLKDWKYGTEDSFTAILRYFRYAPFS